MTDLVCVIENEMKNPQKDLVKRFFFKKRKKPKMTVSAVLAPTAAFVGQVIAWVAKAAVICLGVYFSSDYVGLAIAWAKRQAIEWGVQLLKGAVEEGLAKLQEVPAIVEAVSDAAGDRALQALLNVIGERDAHSSSSVAGPPMCSPPRFWAWPYIDRAVRTGIFYSLWTAIVVWSTAAFLAFVYATCDAMNFVVSRTAARLGVKRTPSLHRGTEWLLTGAAYFIEAIGAVWSAVDSILVHITGAGMRDAPAALGRAVYASIATLLWWLWCFIAYVPPFARVAAWRSWFDAVTSWWSPEAVESTYDADATALLDELDTQHEFIMQKLGDECRLNAGLSYVTTRLVRSRAVTAHTVRVVPLRGDVDGAEGELLEDGAVLELERAGLVGVREGRCKDVQARVVRASGPGAWFGLLGALLLCIDLRCEGGAMVKCRTPWTFADDADEGALAQNTDLDEHPIMDEAEDGDAVVSSAGTSSAPRPRTTALAAPQPVWTASAIDAAPAPSGRPQTPGGAQSAKPAAAVVAADAQRSASRAKSPQSNAGAAREVVARATSPVAQKAAEVRPNTAAVAVVAAQPAGANAQRQSPTRPAASAAAARVTHVAKEGSGQFLDGERVAAPAGACAATAVAIVVHAAATRIPDAGDEFRSFWAAPAKVKAGGVSEVFAKTSAKPGVAANADVALIEFAVKTAVVGERSLFEFVETGHVPPAPARVFAAMRYTPPNPGPGHWIALTRRGASDEWRVHGDTRVDIERGFPKATTYVWLRQKRAGSGPGCARCGRAAEAHDDVFTRTCCVCKRAVFGSCTGLRTYAERVAASRDFFCATCNKTEGRSRRPRHEPEFGGAEEASAAEPVAHLGPPRTSAAATGTQARGTASSSPAKVAQARLAVPKPRSAQGRAAPPSYGEWQAAPPYDRAPGGVFAAPAGFRQAAGEVPAVPPLYTGAMLRSDALTLRARPQGAEPRALSTGVAQEHHRILVELQKLVAERPHLELWPLDQLVAEYFQELARVRNWKPQSLLRKLAACVGAFAKLPLYAFCRYAVHLERCPVLQDVMRRVELESQQAQPQGQEGVTLEDFIKIIQRTNDEEVKVALILQWVTTARPGCVLQLRREDVDLEAGGALRVKFRFGKGVRFRGPYTVPTVVADPTWRAALSKLLARRQSAEALFPAARQVQPLMRAALRSGEDPYGTLRAMRRGSLRTLAQAGVEKQIMMRFSGHTTEKSLMRYLDFGKEAAADNAAGVAAGRHLSGRVSA